MYSAFYLLIPKFLALNKIADSILRKASMGDELIEYDKQD